MALSCALESGWAWGRPSSSSFSSSSSLPKSTAVSSSTRSHSFWLSHRTSFLSGNGKLESLILTLTPTQKQKWSPVSVTALITRRKDNQLDKVIQDQKKLKLVTKVKNLVVKQPGMIMSLRDLGKYRRHIGLQGNRRFISFLKKFPLVFEIFEEGINTVYFRLTEEAESLFLEEQALRRSLEEKLVEKLRKLLMMSIDKRLLIEKISHIKRELGLPDDFTLTILGNYPEFFKVVETEEGQALELVLWDPTLAVSEYEKRKSEETTQNFDEISISGRVPKFRRLDLPKGLVLSKKDREKIRKFEDLPYVSPYSDFTHIPPASIEAEKHCCAVVHELLSLTIEKRMLVDHLTHFRRDFKFSQRVRAMLIRHPELFYVSFKGNRDSVFLRSSYNGSELIEKDPLFLLKQRLQELVTLSLRGIRPNQLSPQYTSDDDEAVFRNDEEDEDEDEDEDEEGSNEDGDWSDDGGLDDVVSWSDTDDEESEVAAPINSISRNGNAREEEEDPSTSLDYIRKRREQFKQAIRDRARAAATPKGPKEKW